MDQRLSCNPISVLVPAIPDMSGKYTGHIWNTQNRNTFFLSLAIPDTSGRCRTETINPLLVILCFSSSISCIPTSQQMTCSTREPSKAPCGKIKYFSIESN